LENPWVLSQEELVSLIAACQKALFAYVRTLVGPNAEVDDILQEVNLVLWRKGQEFDGRTRFLAWACHIAYLQALAHRQKRHRDRIVFLAEDTLATIAEYAGNEVDRIDARLEALGRCLSKLSPGQRRMILMRYEEGGSAQKVADELGRPVGSIRVTLHRARVLLAECIGRALARESTYG